MKQLLILSVVCCSGYVKDQGSLSYIPRSSYVSLFPKFLRVSYFYEQARTHEAILDGEIDLDLTRMVSIFRIKLRSDMPTGARETLWRFSTHYSIISMFVSDAPQHVTVGRHLHSQVIKISSSKVPTQ